MKFPRQLASRADWVEPVAFSPPQNMKTKSKKTAKKKAAKNTLCLWFNKDAQDAARFYAKTFPDSKVTGIHKAPGDFPSGKKGDILTVEFTVLGVPCIGLNGGPAFKHSEAFSFQGRHGHPGGNRPLLERHRQKWRRGKHVRLVQGSLGPVLADHPARAHGRHGGRRRGGEARVRGDDDDAKNRRRQNRGGAARVVRSDQRSAVSGWGCFSEAALG
jgi:hypothetical protein